MYVKRIYNGIKTVKDLSNVLNKLDEDLEIFLDLNPTSYDLDDLKEFPFCEVHEIAENSGKVSYVEIVSWFGDEAVHRLQDLSFQRSLEEYRNIKGKQ